MSFSTTDTIVAIATPQGRGALGVVRLSGPQATRVALSLLARSIPLVPRHATLATLDAGGVRDQVIATSFPAPASYTGDDVVELSAHGSSVVLQSIVRAAVGAGARMAEPGEFTLRAYLNGRIDLPQAEAVADLIDAVTPLQARAAFDQLNGTLTTALAAIDAALFDLTARLEASVDFPDEGYHFIAPDRVADAIDDVIGQIDRLLAASRRGRLLREGAQVAIVGAPNAGKSSLFNALVGAHRAIVTDIPGTTRDLLTEVVDLDGLRVTLVDTAGIRESDHPVEREGVDRARQAAVVSDLILRVVAADQWEREIADCRPQISDLSVDKKELTVLSKVDLAGQVDWPGATRVSVVTGEGIDALIARIRGALAGEALTDPPAVTNLRHVGLLEQVRASLTRASTAVRDAGGSLSEEFILADLMEARQLLEQVTGRRTPDDVLAHVFARFCVGK